MKKTDWKILLAAIVYTLLFYKQEAGLNFFIFSIAISILSLLQNTEKLKKPAWLAAAFGTLFSGFFVFYYGTNLPIVANVISIIFLAGFTFNPNKSLLLSAFNALSSLVLSIPFLIIDFIKERNKPAEEKTAKSNWFKKVLLLLFPLFVVLVFFVLYRDSNPLFLKITEDINLDWLSFPLVKHFLVGLFFMYSFFVHSTIKRLNAFDDNKTDNIDFIDEEKHNKSFFSRFLSLESETYTALALFIMLNILIAVLNAIDINYLWLKAALPQGLVFSDYLHSGTFTLIVSIVFAIAIVIFFFRGIFNFNTKGKALKILGFIWIVQNIVMIVSAMLRNKLYIEQYGLTHKRIGVFVFLVLAVIGLLITFLKIASKKNIWFLFRKNAWAFYAVLVLATAVNWDFQITKYNIKNANKNHIVDLDKNYLAKLSHVNTYMLLKQESDTTPFEIYNNSVSSRYDVSPLQEKIQKLLDYKNRKQWQEISLNKNYNVAQIKLANEMAKINKLDLFSLYIEDVKQYDELNNIKGLDLHNNLLRDNLRGISKYKKIEILNLKNNQIESLDSLPVLEKLKHLNLSNNNIKNFSALEKFQTIEKLNIGTNHNDIEVDKFPILKNLEEINISNSKYNDWTFLANQPKLKKIIYQNGSPYLVKLKSIPSLEIADFYGSSLLNNTGDFFDSLALSKNIKELSLNYCNLGSAYYLTKGKYSKVLFENLERLSMVNNNLQKGVNYLENYTKLKELNISSNGINKLESLKKLVKLESLILDNNVLYSLKGINAFASLKKLSIANNKIKNFEEFTKFTQLENLYVSNNNLNEIDSIINLTKLKKLDISGNDIENIALVKSLTKLTHLYIANTNTTDFSFLYEMKQLKYISLGDIDLEIVEILKEKLPNTELDYYSKNLGKSINYNNNKRAFYSESF